MVIKTKDFSFSKYQYFGILLWDLLRKNWWALGFLVVVLGYQLVQDSKHTGGSSTVILILSALPVLFLAYFILRSWVHTNSKQNKLFFAERTFEIDQHFLTILFEDGSVNKILINNIVRVIKNFKYYRLFLSKKQFIFLPLSAFKRADDIKRFDTILKARKKPS